MPKTIKKASDLAQLPPQHAIRSADDLKGMRSARSIAIKRDAINTEARTVNLAFASETPVERYYGFEILDCRPESVRLSRLNSRAPILVDHVPCDQVGVIENAVMDKDRIGRVQSRYSRSERGQEIFQDIIDEIRVNTSVGYIIHDAILERTEGEVNYYRITDWEPYEVSIVSMPADITVGVGRKLETETQQPAAPAQVPLTKENRTMHKCQLCGAEIAEGATCTCAAVRAAENKRVNDIMTRASEYAARGGLTVAADLLKEKPAATVEDFNQRMLDKITKEQAATTGREASLALSTQVNLRYDKRSLEPFKRSASPTISAEQAAYQSGMWARAIIYGDHNAERWCKDNGLNLRVMTEGSNSAGGFLVPDPLENAIIDLKAEYGAIRKLAEIWPMGSGTLTIPVRKTGTTAYFPGEESTTTESDMSWGNVNLVAKDVSALTRLSIALAEDAIIDLGAKVANEHAYAFAVKEDSCAIDGDGTSTYGNIVGLKALLETSGMAGIYTAATNTDIPTEIIASELSCVMAKLPSYARVGAVWLSSPTFDAAIFARLMAAGGGNTTATLAGQIVQAYLGYPRVVCEPCYSSLTDDLTGKAMVFYGNFYQGIAFGERRGITVQVLRERYAEYRQIGIIGTERIDINCHGVGDTSAAGPIVALIGG